MTRTDSSLVGALLDRRYRVDRLLARGGMSSVYRGVDTRLDRPVAIKIMDPRFADDRSFVERFEREARSAARLHHPHVVAVHDQGLDTAGGDGRAFLIMELVDGGTLRDLLDEQGALDVPLALTVAEPVLSALAAAHDAGLVHRDVKPENVLIGRGGAEFSGLVKVADFGLVRAVASAGTTSSSVILGTVAYLSPEQVTLGSATQRGDVYSTGILLYEMLTGTTPYTGDTALSVAYRHVNNDVPAPSTIRPGIPAPVDELVLRATRRDPEARPADAGEFLRELLMVRSRLGLRPVRVPVPPPPDVDRLSDTEKTMPGFRALGTVPGPPSRPLPAHGPGPRGTMAMHRAPMPPRPRQHTQVTDLRPPEPPAEAAPERRHPWRGRRIAVIAAIVVLLALVGGGTWWFAGGRWVAVPKVTGLDQATAEKSLRDAGFAPSFSTELSNTVPAGAVVRTDPASGTKALNGDQVAVVVSSGRPTVPQVAAGTSAEEAEAAIRQAQLQPRRDGNADVYDDKVPAGAVVGLKPAAGSQLNLGDPVTLVLSRGPAPVPVPDVRGKAHDDAFNTLRAQGFEPFDAGAEFNPDVPGGNVIRTDPATGSTVDGGSSKRVGVYVSSAVDVPAVIGRSGPDAAKVLSDAGLSADFLGKQPTAFSLVVAQDPKPGGRVEKGGAVRLQVIP